LSVLSSSFGKEIEIMGLDLQRFSNIIRFYDIIDRLSPLLDVLNLHLQTILVAVSKENAVVGGVHIVPFSKDVWTIDSLAVDPNYRQQGVGARLISAALRYIEDRQGRKALTYVRADNIPSLRIKKELQGEFFDKRVLLMSNSNKNLPENVGDDLSIREAKSEDASEIFRLCRILDAKKATVFEISPNSFLNSKSELLMSVIGLVSSRKWVLINNGKIVGYADLMYTSPSEAAKIESFYLMGHSNLLSLATSLLNEIFKTLEERKIEKVAVSLSEDQREIINIFESLGFKHITSFYGVAHILA